MAEEVTGETVATEAAFEAAALRLAEVPTLAAAASPNDGNGG